MNIQCRIFKIICKTTTTKKNNKSHYTDTYALIDFFITTTQRHQDYRDSELCKSAASCPAYLTIYIPRSFDFLKKLSSWWSPAEKLHLCLAALGEQKTAERAGIWKPALENWNFRKNSIIPNISLNMNAMVINGKFNNLKIFAAVQFK